ncbi:large conductance mechanosensitive channel protein MscL [Maribacter polysaccharolyticus]|uniref:large conductance mechanosensitive channel protein MscL n=1 Tax=Maribacter polysaccharolyticus TaxID=3020831 RepID=UPI00237FD476|nr:large conductance mechanosensitive channel protein MscL [Maribacter polysaccharolyticus]MDE3743227.1 large conductance mechanosensitive channel protein MscL [Maribacter polysaccharolyticus]
MLKEFKNFIMTGNVIEFAVAVIMAGAVGLVVNGFVADIIMPVVGHFAGGMDFANLKIILTESTGVQGEPGYVAENAIRWGAWVNTLVNLLIVGFVMFVIVKAYNKTKTPPAPPAPKGPSQEDLLAEIRDLLKKQ